MPQTTGSPARLAESRHKLLLALTQGPQSRPSVKSTIHRSVELSNERARRTLLSPDGSQAPGRRLCTLPWRNSHRHCLETFRAQSMTSSTLALAVPFGWSNLAVIL